jgi:hypothetical protein
VHRIVDLRVLFDQQRRVQPGDDGAAQTAGAT